MMKMRELINCVPPKDLSEYKNVFVYVEHREGKIKRSSLEMLGEGRKLADKSEEKLVGVMVGNNLDAVAKEAAEYGCDIVYGAQSPDLEQFRSMPYTNYLAEMVEKHKPNIFLISGTREGRDLVSRIAIRTMTGVAADCIELDIIDKKILSAWRPSFGDKTIDQILCRKHRPQTITSRPGSYKLAERHPGNKCEIHIEDVKVPKEMLRREVLNFHPKDKLDLTSAKRVVSGGMGLGKKDGFKLVQQLADELDAEVGASRPVVDIGWIPYEHQVGQTGQTVRAKLYVAAGISGKIQHTVGMKDSENIISINNDPEADIAKFSDYFVNADLYDAIPRIIEEIKKYKSGGKKIEKKAEEKAPGTD